jgi:hypothetical protein
VSSAQTLSPKRRRRRRRRDGTRNITKYWVHFTNNLPSPLKKDQIDKKSLEISRADTQVYTNMQDLSDELPDNSPRFVLLSYPLTLTSGRLSVPYVMLNYLPATCNQETRMLYAGAKELMRNQSEAGRIIEIDAAEEVETIEEKLQSED